MTPEQSYNALPFSEYAKLPEVSAVYEVWNGDTCLYVGKATNLKKRWKIGHHVGVECAQAGATEIRWTLVSKGQLSSMESETFDRLKPTLNKNRPNNAPDYDSILPEYRSDMNRGIEEDMGKVDAALHRIACHNWDLLHGEESKQPYARKVLRYMGMAKNPQEAIKVWQYHYSREKWNA